MNRFPLQLFLSLVLLSTKYGLRSNQINKLKQKRQQFFIYYIYSLDNDVINVNGVIDVNFADVSKYEIYIHQMNLLIKCNRMVYV